LRGNIDNLVQIKSYLELWETNHVKFEKMAAKAPILNYISEHSANLSALAKVGNQALDFYSTNKKPSEDWIQKSKIIVSKARNQGGRTELQIVDSIEQLILASQNYAMDNLPKINVKH
jgi:hypothetical protein